MNRLLVLLGCLFSLAVGAADYGTVSVLGGATSALQATGNASAASAASSVASLNSKFLANASGVAEVPSRMRFYNSEHLGWYDEEGADGSMRTLDYTYAIAHGNVANHIPYRGFGDRTSISTGATGNDIWQGASAVMPIPDQTTGEQMTLVSTSANDTLLGSGCRQVDVHYLNASGVPASEIVNMSGVSPVDTIATNIRFVENIHSETVGATGSTEGVVTIHKIGDPSVVYNAMVAGSNMALNSARMIPAGQTFYMTGLTATATDNTAILVRLLATITSEGTVTPGLFFTVYEPFRLENSTVTRTLRLPLAFPSLSILKGNAVPQTSGGSATLSYEGWYEPNE